MVLQSRTANNDIIFAIGKLDFTISGNQNFVILDYMLFNLLYRLEKDILKTSL